MDNNTGFTIADLGFGVYHAQHYDIPKLTSEDLAAYVKRIAETKAAYSVPHTFSSSWSKTILAGVDAGTVTSGSSTSTG